MLDQSTRTAILELHERGHGSRNIARALALSRGAVLGVLRSRSAEVPPLDRAEQAEPHRQEILELHARCKGNLVRVHEELVLAGAALSYPALTAFCRRHGIGHEPAKPAGQYHFDPGQEMQHDTSPHDVELGGRLRRVQTASLVLCHSRMLFFQHYPTFTRFDCKVFLTDAVRYLDGCCATCMIDNTHVVVLHGTGSEMVPVPEMAAFAERLGFGFQAHEKGDANRSARVERPFYYIETNFHAGRKFEDFDHLNREAVIWCDKVNGTFKRHLRAVPRELYASERSRLKPLPLWVPEVYALHHRIVDIEGYVTVHAHRYSAPYALIARRVEVRETKDEIQIFEGPRRVATHRRIVGRDPGRTTLAEHRPPRRPPGQAGAALTAPAEEHEILRAEPELAEYVIALRTRAAGRGTMALRQLLRLVRDYPRGPLLEAVRAATHYRLYDLERLERMILRNIAHDYFPPPPLSDGTAADDDKEPDDEG